MIQIRNLVKRYSGEHVTANAVNNISLEVAPGDLVTLLGPSGCGKTTTLRMIAGLEEPSSGEILFGSDVIFSSRLKINVPVHRRPIAMVFQSYAIWPHMDVFANVAFPLRLHKKKFSRAEIRERTEHALELVGLKDFIHRSSTALSGGQQQRVALARALVKEPQILLLDEPLSNLDAKLREQMRDEIRELQQREKMTTIFVTHDQNEALAVSDRIMVMDRGNVLESGLPRDVYGYPVHEFTANFIGVSNTLEGVATGYEDGHCTVETPLGTLVCQSETAIAEGERVVSYARPEYFSLSREAHEKTAWRGVVEKISFQGDFADYFVNAGGRALRVRVYDGAEFDRGETVYVHPSMTHIRIHQARSAPAPRH